MKSKFKEENPDKEKRKQLSDSAIRNNPGKIPVILEKDETSKLPDIKKTRYILEENFTVAEFITLIRNILKLNEGEALYLLAKGKHNLTGDQTIGDIYKLYKDKGDGFLYIVYSSVVIFG